MGNFNSYYKKFFVVLIIIVALAIIRIYQAPVHSGAVLDAFISATSTPSNLQVIFFDVGQGDASLIIAPDGEDILIDGGPDNKVVQKLGEYLPYTDRKIEYIILTHPHADHIDGLNEVLKRYEVGEVITTGVDYGTADYQEFISLIKEKNIAVKIIDKSQEINIAGIDFDFLEPTKSLVDKKIENLNNSSIVFRLNYVSSSILYTGDFENEEQLVSSTEIIKSDILKVGHHGSTNANSLGFIKSVSPEYAVISVGAGNSYGLPNYRSIHYLEETGSQIFRTDVTGDIKFSCSAVSCELAK